MGIELEKYRERSQLGAEFYTTRSEHALSALRKVVNWGRRWSLFQYPFAVACCAMEYMSVGAAHYDVSRFGAEIPRFTPRQADLLFIVGTIVQRQAPILKRVYDSMCEPKWVVAFGVCASTGGFYDNYATLPGADRVIPVDVYIPGCPPRPEQVLDGLRALQELIDHDTSKPLTGTIVVNE